MTTLRQSHTRPLRAAVVLGIAIFGAAHTQAEVDASAEAPVRRIDAGGAAIFRWAEPGTVGGREIEHYAISFDGGRTHAVARTTSFDVALRSRRFDPLRTTEPAAIEPALRADDDVSLFIVQFECPPFEALRGALDEAGASVRWYVPNHALLVELSAAARARVERLPFVRWIGPYHPADRLDPQLLARANESSEPVRVNVMLTTPDRAAKESVAARLHALGGRVDRVVAGKYLLEATLDRTLLRAAARFDEVLYIDAWSPGETDVDLARAIGGAAMLENTLGYTGARVRGEVLDVGFNLAHVDFHSRPLLYHTPVGMNSHGAATSGILFGDGAAEPLTRGMLPGATGIVGDWAAVASGEGRWQHTAELVLPPYEALFQSASVGNDRTTEYTTLSADLDAALFDFDIVLCQSQSNAGNQESRPQAWAKNAISVGGVRHFDTLDRADDCWGCALSAASIGPAADGRIKPDLCHFYDAILAATTGSPTAYAIFGGTSGSTPIVAGYVGLLFEMWADGRFGGAADPFASAFASRCHMTTAKALLINTAYQYPFEGTEHDLGRMHQGWGMPDLAALDALRSRLLVVDEAVVLDDLESVTYEVEVAPGVTVPLRATLVWADPPGNPAALLHRINDLSLRAVAPDGTAYWGNHGLVEGPWSLPGGEANTIDTVENVFVEAPAAGTWTIEVVAHEINADGHVETPQIDADFALVVSGLAPAPPPLTIRVPVPLPVLVEAGEVVTFAVHIEPGSEGVAAASARWRAAPTEPFETIPLAHVEGTTWLAELPAAHCGDAPGFHLSAEGDGGTIVLWPPTAPAASFTYEIGRIETIYEDHFAAENGWTVESTALQDGAWERGAPQGGTLSPGDRGEPAFDYFGEGQCWTTRNEPGDHDVDGGPTSLLSPLIDLSAHPDATLTYARWFTNDDADADRLTVEISNDGGATWTMLEQVGGESGWREVAFSIADRVEPTELVRLRFSAIDDPNDSITEAAVDGVRIETRACSDAVAGDVNGDGAVDFEDLSALLIAWGPCAPGAPCPADFGSDGAVGFADLVILLQSWG